MRHFLIHLFGGFATHDEAIDSIDRMDDAAARHRLLRLCVRRLFKAISKDDILHFDQRNNAWLFMGKPMSNGEFKNIQQQAAIFERSVLWRVLRSDVRYQLSKKMFEEGRVKDDFVWGQMATFLWDIILTRLKQLSEIKTLDKQK